MPKSLSIIAHLINLVHPKQVDTSSEGKIPLPLYFTFLAFIVVVLGLLFAIAVAIG